MFINFSTFLFIILLLIFNRLERMFIFKFIEKIKKYERKNKS